MRAAAHLRRLSEQRDDNDGIGTVLIGVPLDDWVIASANTYTVTASCMFVMVDFQKDSDEMGYNRVDATTESMKVICL